MCFWCRDPPFDNWQKKADRQKCSFLLFDHILPTPTAAADNPLNIYPDISSAVAAAPVSNMSIIIIIIIIIIITLIIIIIVIGTVPMKICREMEIKSWPLYCVQFA